MAQPRARAGHRCVHLFRLMALVLAVVVTHATSASRPESNNAGPLLLSGSSGALGPSSQSGWQLAPPPASPLVLSSIHGNAPMGLDLVAFNRRRFELDHQHTSSEANPKQLKTAELIESKLASLPDQLLASLPDDLNRQVLQSLATEQSFLGGLPSPADLSAAAESIGSLSEDPDGASIERLTKSCLTVHASSMRPEQLNATFHLYTPSNPEVPFIIWPQATRLELLRGSPLDPRLPIKWIVHGFHTNVDKSEWMVDAKDRILANENANVILTDWRRGASPTLAFYPKAAANAHVVAKLIVKLLRRIRDDIDLRQVHLIGHSLGAHIMGFVGSTFTEEHLYGQQHALNSHGTTPDPAEFTGALIGRITACDPALPCFGPTSGAPNNAASQATVMAGIESRDGSGVASDWTPTMWTHLRPDSALVVEVMHSNPGVMGYADPLGDFDFYPNGFDRQPGCGSEPGSKIKRTKRQLSSVANKFNPIRMLSFNKPDRKHQAQTSARASNNQNSNRISQTIDKFIKPIRDFFQGYTCSHHRSVDYMVESMYYERVPQPHKLDKDHVCQMIGYRCDSYESFKRGFCFKCPSELHCRAFTMEPRVGSTGPSPSELDSLLSDKFYLNTETTNQSGEQRSKARHRHGRRAKRVLPTTNRHELSYKSSQRPQYYFDTRPSKPFCLHHYHVLIKYKWLRVRHEVSTSAFTLFGTLANITQRAPMGLHRFTHQSFTMLLTNTNFLGQIEAMHLHGHQLRPTLIEYIEVSYMSNLDPRVRALGSSRLCRASRQRQQQEFGSATNVPSDSSWTLFVRCTSSDGMLV